MKDVKQEMQESVDLQVKQDFDAHMNKVKSGTFEYPFYPVSEQNLHRKNIQSMIDQLKNPESTQNDRIEIQNILISTEAICRAMKDNKENMVITLKTYYYHICALLNHVKIKLIDDEKDPKNESYKSLHDFVKIKMKEFKTLQKKLDEKVNPLEIIQIDEIKIL